jgi:hypothetical protein
VKVTRRQDVKATVDAEVVGFKAEGEMETKVREYDGATVGEVKEEIDRAGGLPAVLSAKAQLAGAAKG